MSNTGTASVKHLVQNFGTILKATVRRFCPTAILLTITFVLACFDIYEAGDYDDLLKIFLYFYTITGAVLNVALFLWAENCKSLKTKVITLALANIAWLWYSVLAADWMDSFSNEMLVMPGLLAAVLAVVISVFCLPFFRCGNDVPFWKFALQALTAVLIAAIATGVLCGAISLLFTAVQHLFDIDGGNRLLICINVFFVVLLFPALVLMQLPETDKLINEQEFRSDKFIIAVMHYLFMPLLVLYVAVLYVYLLKIVFTWQLPDGWVSVLVSVSMFFMVLISMAIYGDRITFGSKIDTLFVKYSPYIMMPLLLLMTVGIIRRFSDYGLTVPRLYLLAVNVWFWAVCIISIMFKQRRIIWIPASFCLLFLIASYGPWSMANITLNSLRSQVVERLNEEHLSLPITTEEFYRWAANRDTTNYAISDKLDYLTHNYPHSTYEDIVDGRIYAYRVSNSKGHSEDVFIGGRNITGGHIFRPDTNLLNLNRNIKTFRIIDTIYYFNDEKTIPDTLTFSFGSHDFKINTLDFIDYSNDYSRKNIQDDFIILTAPGATLAISYYSFYVRKDNSDLDLQGYLFEE